MLSFVNAVKSLFESKQLTREQVSANRKSEVFVNGHCYICNKTYTDVPAWSKHKDTAQHKQARTKLLAQLGPEKKTSKKKQSRPKPKIAKLKKKPALNYETIEKDEFKDIVDDKDGFHHCRICNKTFKVKSDIPFDAKYGGHKVSKGHKEAKQKLLLKLGGAEKKTSKKKQSRPKPKIAKLSLSAKEPVAEQKKGAPSKPKPKTSKLALNNKKLTKAQGIGDKKGDVVIQKESEKKTSNKKQSRPKPKIAKLSAKDKAIRDSWKAGNQIEVWSHSESKWVKAKIHYEVNDIKGKWLQIEYNGEKEMIARYDEYARPIAKQNKCASSKPNSSKSTSNNKQLTKDQVSGDKKGDIIIDIDGKDHCRICNTTFTKTPKWADHQKTAKHKSARTKLLNKFKLSSSNTNTGRKRKREEDEEEEKAMEPPKKRQRVKKKTALNYEKIEKDEFKNIVDDKDGFHHCRICDKTFKVKSDIPFDANYGVHKVSKAHKEAKQKLLSKLGGAAKKKQNKNKKPETGKITTTTTTTTVHVTTTTTT